MQKEVIKSSGIDFIRLGAALFFMVAVLTYSFMSTGGVPNNVGPAVVSKALTMGGAIVIAAIFEASGALIAGGDVVKTIKKGIIDISAFGANTDSFIWAMMAALLAAALWLNFATFAKAPVSTTHSIVGGVMGAGIAATGFGIVAWGTMGKIAASWVISPVLGGIIAATFLFAIKKTIIFKENKIEAAVKWVPVFVAIMSWAFVTYPYAQRPEKSMAQHRGHSYFSARYQKPTFLTAALFGLIAAVIVYVVMKTVIAKKLPVWRAAGQVSTCFLPYHLSLR